MGVQNQVSAAGQFIPTDTGNGTEGESSHSVSGTRGNPKVTPRLVLFSGGAASYCAAKRCVERYGREKVSLVFTDTKNEDASTYTFIREATKKLGVQLYWIAEGRSVWEVFHDNRMIGNSRMDPCSRILKRELCEKWLRRRWNPGQIVIVYGMTWEEAHRIETTEGRGRRPYWTALGYETEFPMNEEPRWFKDRIIEEITNDGLTLPDLYRVGGFAHNNCAGGCIKAGMAHWLRLLEVFPDRFANFEAKEQSLRDLTGKNISILRDRRGGTAKPFTLSQLRSRQTEMKQTEDGRFDVGGCGCMVEDDA